MTTRITVSALALASRCLACYWEVHVLRRKRPIGPHLLFGRAVHRALELYERSGRNLYVGYAAIEGYREVLAPEAFAEARRVLAAYDAAEGDRDGRTRYIEEPVECRVGPLVIHGRVDRVDEWRGDLELVDYKTGRQPDLATARIQCAAYALGLLESHGRAAATWTVHLLTTGERRSIEPIVSAHELRSLFAPVCDMIGSGLWTSPDLPRCRRHVLWRLPPDTAWHPSRDELQRVLF